MRLLQLVTRPQRRGAEVFARELCGELERRGHATRTAYLYAAPEPRLELAEGDVDLAAEAGSRLEKLPGFQPALLAGLRSVVADFRPDVVQVNGSRSVKYGSLLRRFDRRAAWSLVYRSIGTPSDWLRGPLHRWVVRRLVMSRMDGVVAVSEATRRSLEASYGLAVPTTVIPRGVDPRRFVPARPAAEVRRGLGTPAGAAVMLYVGSLTAEKRPDRLLRVARAAARRTADRPAELWVAGDGPGRAALEAAGAEELTLRLLGTRADVADLMGAADLLLLTSDTEGMPGVVLEAGCVGLPVVATRVGGTAEAVADGETGVVVDPNEEDAMAAAAVALLADAERRQRYGAAARRRVEERFAIGPIAERYLAHYARVGENRRRRLGAGR